MARAIARGDASGTSDEDQDEDDGTEAFAQHGGAVAEAMAKLRERQEEPASSSEIEVWEENWPAVEWFLALMTQWHRLAESGMPAGLNYSAAHDVARLLRIKTTRELFSDLQVLEMSYIAECVRRWPKPQAPRR